MSKSPLVHSNSMICRNAPKRCHKATKCVQIRHQQPHTKRGRILGYMAQNAIPRAPNPCATPHFLWFPPLQIAHMPRQTPALGPTRLPHATSSSPNRWAPKSENGSTRSPGAKQKKHFSTNDPRPHRMPKQAVLAHCGPVVAFLRLQRALKTGHFGTKNGFKMHFSKDDPSGGGGGMRSAFFGIFCNFFSHFLGRSFSIMFKRKHSSGIILCTPTKGLSCSQLVLRNNGFCGRRRFCFG